MLMVGQIFLISFGDGSPTNVYFPGKREKTFLEISKRFFTNFVSFPTDKVRHGADFVALMPLWSWKVLEERR